MNEAQAAVFSLIEKYDSIVILATLFPMAIATEVRSPYAKFFKRPIRIKKSMPSEAACPPFLSASAKWT